MKDNQKFTQQLTVPADPNRQVTGYIVNTMISENAQRSILAIQRKIGYAFPDAIWLAPDTSLHITLLDLLAPLVDYGKDKDVLFGELQETYDKVLSEILLAQAPIDVTFDAIEVYPAAIIVKGHDDGSFERIRQQFLSKVDLLPGTKQPPSIIHVTICKFVKPISVDEVRTAVQYDTVSFKETVNTFQVARESQVFMLKYKTIKSYDLT
jgi:hypothetical protein